MLGPQSPEPTLHDVLRTVEIRGPVAVVTAGWQEREGEVDELANHIATDATDLRLYHRAEEVFAGDSAFAEAYRARQALLMDLQRFYRLRLGHLAESYRALLGEHGSPRVLSMERRAALRALRTLDNQHYRRVRRIHERFEDTERPAERPAIASHRREIAGILGASVVLLVAGGHVGVLVNRLRLFGLADLAEKIPVIAWSAGAMALSERVVLFHDHPVHGPNNAEVADVGLGLFRGVVPLPHARRRLHLDDPGRVGVLARRCSPARCVTLDPGAVVVWRDGQIVHAETAQRLGPRGALTPVRAA
jgi:hypothetical protein